MTRFIADPKEWGNFWDSPLHSPPFNLISRPASASLKMLWVVNWSLRLFCPPPLPSHPNLAAKSNPKTQCGCTSGVSKLETSSKSVVSISRLPDRETKGRQNEFRVKVLLYFLFIAAIHSLPLCPPPPWPRSAPALGQHLSIALNPKM